jgi:ribosome-interacting GTPase 1
MLPLKSSSVESMSLTYLQIDQLIDVIEGNRKYMPAIYVLNKIDQLTIEELDIIAELPHHCPISAHHDWNIDELREMIWEYCKMLRMYVSFAYRPVGRFVNSICTDIQSQKVKFQTIMRR